NQVTMSVSLSRRLAKATWKSPEQQVRLTRLPKLRECLAGVAALLDRARDLETQALAAFYQRDRLDRTLLVPEIEALDRERRKLLREVFLLRQVEPNDVVIAVYSEHRDTLMEFVLAYHAMAKDMGQVMALEYVLPPPGARTSGSRAIREEPKKPDKALQD